MILSIKLHKFKRLDQAGIETIEIDFTGGLHIFIGSNGSGKTSLMKEISFLPADKNDYHIGGVKEIQGILDGTKYTARSNIDNPPTHSLIRHDNRMLKELNPLGAITTQRELVRDIFGITPALQNVLTRSSEGKGFSLMSPLERKSWMAVISNIDYEYAVGVQTRIKESLKKEKSVLTFLHEKLNSVSADLMEDSELIRSKSKIDLASKDLAIAKEILVKINSCISFAKTYRGGLNDTVAKTMEKCFESRDLIQAAAKLTKYDSSIAPKENLSNISKSLNRHRARADVLSAELRGIDSALEVISITEKFNAVDGVKELEDMRIAYNDMPRLDHDALVTSTSEDWPRVHQKLIALAASAPRNLTYTSDDYDKHTNSFIELKSSLESIAKEIKRLDYECGLPVARRPKCPHCREFLNTDDPQKTRDYLLGALNAAKYNLSVGNDSAVRHQELLASITSSLEFNRQIKSLGEADRLAINHNGVTIWDHINSRGLMSKPDDLALVLEQGDANARILSDLGAAEIAIKAMQTKLAEHSAAVSSQGDLGVLQSRRLQLLESVSELTSILESESLAADALNKSVIQADEMDRLGESLDAMVASYPFNAIRSDMELLRTFTVDAIDQLEGLLAVDQSMVAAHVSADGLASGVQSDIETYTSSISNLALIESNLSPKTGIIGEAINSFVEDMLGGMNKIISEVWSTRMTVEPPVTSGDQGFFLSYKFPVDFGGDIGVRDDIREGSKAMREVFDLAFAVITSELAGTEPFPLYLDEFGHSLDDLHVGQSVDAISALISDRSLQAFLASHNHQLYAALPYAEVTALCLKNVHDCDTSIVNRTTTITMK